MPAETREGNDPVHKETNHGEIRETKAQVAVLGFLTAGRDVFLSGVYIDSIDIVKAQGAHWRLDKMSPPLGSKRPALLMPMTFLNVPILNVPDLLLCQD